MRARQVAVVVVLSHSGRVGLDELEELLEMPEAALAGVFEEDFDTFLHDEARAVWAFLSNDFARVLTNDLRLWSARSGAGIVLAELRCLSRFDHVLNDWHFGNGRVVSARLKSEGDSLTQGSSHAWAGMLPHRGGQRRHRTYGILACSRM
jgi:hypothetical protein